MHWLPANERYPTASLDVAALKERLLVAENGVVVQVAGISSAGNKSTPQEVHVN